MSMLGPTLEVAVVFIMVVVLRAYGLKVVIYRDDHKPAHVHVLSDGEAKIDLVGSDGRPRLLWAD